MTMVAVWLSNYMVHNYYINNISKILLVTTKLLCLQNYTSSKISNCKVNILYNYKFYVVILTVTIHCKLYTIVSMT